jgi:hypothetical protein
MLGHACWAECRSNLVRKNRRTIAADENKYCRSAMQFQPHSFLSTVVSFLIIILLLLPASSSTPSTLYTLYPPTDNSWIRPSTSPVLTASQPWEGISAGSFAQDRFSADTRDALWRWFMLTLAQGMRACARTSHFLTKTAATSSCFTAAVGTHRRSAERAAATAFTGSSTREIQCEDSSVCRDA